MRLYLDAGASGSLPAGPFTHAAAALAACFDRIVELFERGRTASRDSFFAEAIDLRDLEHRIHYYERTGLTHY